MWPSSRRTICNDTHIARFPARSQSCAAEDFGRFTLVLVPSLSLLQFRRSHSPSNRQTLRFRATDMNRGGNHSLDARNGANIPASRYGLGDLDRMEHPKLANGSGHKPIGHSPSPALRDQMDAARSGGGKTARKKTARKKAESARPLRKEVRSKSKSDKLVCRYCGSDDLAPSFIKRRDRRCRKCFSKRYGSATRTRKAKVKK
jgi:hypothetical protein